MYELNRYSPVCNFINLLFLKMIYVHTFFFVLKPCDRLQLEYFYLHSIFHISRLISLFDSTKFSIARMWFIAVSWVTLSTSFFPMKYLYFFVRPSSRCREHRKEAFVWIFFVSIRITGRVKELKMTSNVH